MTDFLRRDGWDMAFDDGGGSEPALILCHALGADRSMWDPQMEMLGSQRRVVRYDHRGHGKSGAPPGPYSMADLGADLIGLADHLGLARFAFCGISMGGQVGLWLATHHPDRVGHLVLANSAAKIGTEEAWEERIAKVRQGGIQAIVEVVVERFFSEGWRQTHADETEQARETLRAIDPEGYVGCCTAIRDTELSGALSSIRSPTLLIGGSHDVSTPPEAQQVLAQAIPDAELVVLDAAHLSNVERPEEFSATVSRFLTG